MLRNSINDIIQHSTFNLLDLNKVTISSENYLVKYSTYTAAYYLRFISLSQITSIAEFW